MSRAVDVVSNVGREVGCDALVGYEEAYHRRREMRRIWPAGVNVTVYFGKVVCCNVESGREREALFACGIVVLVAFYPVEVYLEIEVQEAIAYFARNVIVGEQVNARALFWDLELRLP